MVELGDIEELHAAYNEQIDDVYGALFEGGFLNFGYWRGIDLTSLSRADRLLSMQQLYRVTLRSLDITPQDRLLEVACGRGRGTALALDEFFPAEAHGIDLLPSQIEKAKELNAQEVRDDKGRLQYSEGSADSIPYADGYFDKVFTIEAIHHFPDLDDFVSDVARVTRKPARLTITAALSPTLDVPTDKLAELLGDFDDGVSVHYSVVSVERALKENGFTDVHVSSIGDDVWYGMVSWANQTEFKDSLIGNWIKAHEDGIVDYYVVSASTE